MEDLTSITMALITMLGGVLTFFMVRIENSFKENTKAFQELLIFLKAGK